MRDNGRDKLMRAIPDGARTELLRLATVRGGQAMISEIRLRSFGCSSAVISGERLHLAAAVDCNDLSYALEVLTDGAVYSHRDTICRGYISLGDGIRVGISGTAHYDGGAITGVNGITSLVFRLPTAAFECREELLRVFLSSRRGILVYSPPGEGKTSALRSLALGLGMMGLQVAVVDERCEFVEGDYIGASVDILRGYRRAEGIEIALRTLSPDVIIVDEIGRLSEAEAMLESLSAGVRVAISAHASSTEEVMHRPSLRPFIDACAVDVLVGIKNVEGKRNISVLGV